ncbi:MAG: hypothetical protein JRI23_17300 [Deltaproteobacteria bacterium]|jgi:hypothetical protein|nr:hypothetical protein [Deltaproteobacteria bacterium]MBW2533576.1 hypothetical protein [Deltaproteobacteria bacterium]
MRQFRILPEAEEELTEAAQWYEAKRPGLGVELVMLVDRAVEEIREAPEGVRSLDLRARATAR